ncbi:hypothetical protein LXG23DRAFT_22612 [Yarrowia lipolytica]|uniref:Uncharacterized protein n=1 Tax=Yarrowia lipolytica TaxID=4952 RepID=A0A1D8NAX1_YARLL|nr:hypothetical protein YALI1_C17904g [Yarrowia lipolytica]KAB8282370.1 hypothetical protein BKA91DRAFT_138531 [Yarrowia lipolytica]KAE8171728.1 hypothetical protein BKA90DRAFT_138591 [Yarrowia lipolytica]KAJ8053391.1 hypothetical protein LXG23DRAFT_22612 [Yarrowia lipolytica]RMI95320.1 hypothetical protein BD777DRAFT_130176 [Yarrowia lipolytica]
MPKKYTKQYKRYPSVPNQSTKPAVADSAQKPSLSAIFGVPLSREELVETKRRARGGGSLSKSVGPAVQSEPCMDPEIARFVQDPSRITMLPPVKAGPPAPASWMVKKSVQEPEFKRVFKQQEEGVSSLKRLCIKSVAEFYPEHRALLDVYSEYLSTNLVLDMLPQISQLSKYTVSPQAYGLLLHQPSYPEITHLDLSGLDLRETRVLADWLLSRKKEKEEEEVDWEDVQDEEANVEKFPNLTSLCLAYPSHHNTRLWPMLLSLTKHFQLSKLDISGWPAPPRAEYDIRKLAQHTLFLEVLGVNNCPWTSLLLSESVVPLWKTSWIKVRTVLADGDQEALKRVRGPGRWLSIEKQTS